MKKIFIASFGSDAGGIEKSLIEFYVESTFEKKKKKYRNYLITKKGIAQLIGDRKSVV